ncbi:MAG: hypothetical protein WB297_01475 [Actinomycetota bacterium]
MAALPDGIQVEMTVPEFLEFVIVIVVWPTRGPSGTVTHKVWLPDVPHLLVTAPSAVVGTTKAAIMGNMTKEQRTSCLNLDVITFPHTACCSWNTCRQRWLPPCRLVYVDWLVHTTKRRNRAIIDSAYVLYVVNVVAQ